MKKTFQGYAVLAMSLLLLVVCALIALYIAKASHNHQRIVNTNYRGKQAFEAAQAGLDYGLVYLNNNKATITQDPDSDGYINPSPNPLTSSSMTNPPSTGSFSVVYSNPTANNFKRLLITSTGTSQDGTVTHHVSQLVHVNSILVNFPDHSLTALGNVTVQGNVNIANTFGDKTIKSGGSTVLIGSAQTTTSRGKSSTPGNIQNDVTQNAFPGMTGAQYFYSFFSDTPSNVKALVDTYYSNIGSTNYSSLLANSNPARGNSIWIDQTAGIASLSGNITIGTTASPVLLIVNGSLNVSGGVTINGFVYVTQDWINGGAGGTTINGGIAVQGNVSINGTPNINYDPNILNNVTLLGGYSKIAGTWNDF